MKNILKSLLLLSTCSLSFAYSASDAKPQPAKLFATLPDYCPTPDAFDIAPDGNLTLSCPNFANSSPSTLMRVTQDGEVSKISEILGVPEGMVNTGHEPPFTLSYIDLSE